LIVVIGLMVGCKSPDIPSPSTPGAQGTPAVSETPIGNAAIALLSIDCVRNREFVRCTGRWQN
jgi:hypothetical protein